MIDLIEKYSGRAVGSLQSGAQRSRWTASSSLPPLPPGATSSASARTIASMRRSSRGAARAGAVKGAEIDEYPAVFSKPPTTVVASGDTVSLHPHATSAVDYEAELAIVIGKGGPRHRTGACLRPRLWLHHRQRCNRARSAAQSQAVVPGEGARHLLSDGSVDRDRRRARCNRSHCEMLGQRRASARREIPAISSSTFPRWSQRSQPGSPCSRATSSPPARPPASESASIRRAFSRRAMKSRYRSRASGRLATDLPDPEISFERAIGAWTNRKAK